MASEQVRALALHLNRLWNRMDAESADICRAESILAAPQKHINALVAAGVLAKKWCNPEKPDAMFQDNHYAVIKPEPPKTCRHCGEQVQPRTYGPSSVRPGLGWQHVDGARQCSTFAEPQEANAACDVPTNTGGDCGDE